MIPKTLNGYPVVAYSPRNLQGDTKCYAVIILRKPNDYVTATWSVNMGDEWCWGHCTDNIYRAMEIHPNMRWHFPHGIAQTMKDRVARVVLSQLLDEALENGNIPDASFARFAGCTDGDVYDWCLRFLGLE